MGGSCLADRLAHYVELTAREHEALEALEQQERRYRRGSVVLRENESARDLFIVQKGWLYSSVLLQNGMRQIMRLHFPGDVIGASNIAYPQASESTVSVTDSVLCPFDKDQLAALFRDHPRLSALIFTITVAERVSLADRLASIGRTSARARVASILCEIATRLQMVEGGSLGAFQVPLTQEEIGDATGLTAVHVNRMMRGLVDDGLIERRGNTVRILDEARLAREGNFTNRFATLDTSWLPNPV